MCLTNIIKSETKGSCSIILHTEKNNESVILNTEAGRGEGLDRLIARFNITQVWVDGRTGQR